MKTIWTAGHWSQAVQTCHERHDLTNLHRLAEHQPHASHCGGYEVLAWPCPTAAKVLDELSLPPESLIGGPE